MPANNNQTNARSSTSSANSVLVEGCRLPVRMPDSDDSEASYQIAEIVAHKVINNEDSYYVHFIDFQCSTLVNKRLDCWLTADKMDLTQIQFTKKDARSTAGCNGAAGPSSALFKLESAPGPCSRSSSPDRDSTMSDMDIEIVGAGQLELGTTALSRSSSITIRNTGGPGRRRSRQSLTSTQSTAFPAFGGATSVNVPTMTTNSTVDDDSLDSTTSVGALMPPPTPNAPQQPRSTGSMSAHNADDTATRVRNIEMVELGKHRIQPWYFSPYPQSQEKIVKSYR
uniref:histone acetyltransferase n=1 Tax=Romanomermis culicivorax TaxID=13658 RepID=A0A915KYC0_ROMCU